MWRMRGAFVLLLGASLVAHPQTAPPTPAGTHADELFQAQKWDQAAAAYEALLKSDPANATAWFRLGVARHSLQQLEAAAAAYEQARRHGFVLGVLSVRAAAAYARLGDNDKAFAWVERALQVGVGPKAMRQIPAFESLREDPRFSAMMTRYEQPCSGPQYRVFDFWVGDWDVQDPSGQHVGVNSVQKIVGDCILLENWTGDGGGSGKSLNFYHAGTGKWRQTWVDDVGRVLDVDGELRDGVMWFEGDIYQKDSSKVRYRLRFFPEGPDRVRQLIEHSVDSGKNWVTWFEGIYLRQKPASPAGTH